MRRQLEDTIGKQLSKKLAAYHIPFVERDVIVDCQNCGNQVELQQAEYNQDDLEFCTVECLNIYERDFNMLTNLDGQF